MAATDSDSMHDSMTRLRMKMVQQKIANEKDKLDQRPDTVSTDHDVEHQLKLQHAVYRRQELLDRIRQEQLNRPRTASPRRRFTPSPILLPPPTRRSLPDISRSIVIKDNRGTNNMSQVKHVIEHRGQDSFRPYYLPPIQQPFFPQQIPAMAPPPQVIQQPAPQVIQQQPPQIIQQAPPIIHAPPPIVQSMPAMPAVHTSPIINHHVEPIHHSQCGNPNKWFNKGDFMDMMMMQNAQMHHMAMQQLMIKSLGGAAGGSERVQHHHYPQTAPAAPQMYHHSLPQMGFGMDMGGYGRAEWSRSNYNVRGGGGGSGSAVYYDDGTNYYVYH